MSSGGSGAVNVRSAPGTQYAIIGNLAAGQVYQAMAQIAGGAWLQVSVNGQAGWVAASVARLDGDCVNLAIIAAPVGAPLAATVAPPPTSVPPTNAPLAPTATITPSQTPMPLADLTITITAASLSADGSVYVSWTVNNVGTGAAAGNFWVEVCFDTSCSPTFIMNAIQPGESLPWSSNTFLSSPPAGLYYVVTVNADVDNIILESNEGNNSATRYAQ